VAIQIEKGTFNDNKRKIVVSGRSEQDVASALNEIALERALIPVESTLIEHVCGENHKNLTFF
jgi:hypothetical protein